MKATVTERPISAMPQSRSVSATRARLGAISLATAGILFVLYPTIRPFSDETSLHGAVAFASTSWVLAHMLAMLGFTLLAVGLLALYLCLQWSSVERVAFSALVLSFLGIGLTLPYYGGEAFGLHAIGQEALRRHSVELVQLADNVRSGPQLVMFGAGLLLLATGAILVATAVWRSGTISKGSGLPFALGFALYIPQFYGTQPVRVAHGLLVAAGCLWVAAGLWRLSKEARRLSLGRA